MCVCVPKRIIPFITAAKGSSMAESPLMQLNIGMAAGCIEVLLMQPAVALKNAHQQNRQISLAPSVLYRGVVINCLAYGPITATQFGTKAFVDSVTPHAWKTKQPTTCHIATSTVAGVTSALIAGPSELVMTQQQTSGLTLKAQARALVRQHGAGVLARAIRPCAADCGAQLKQPGRDGTVGQPWEQLPLHLPHGHGSLRAPQVQPLVRRGSRHVGPADAAGG